MGDIDAFAADLKKLAENLATVEAKVTRIAIDVVRLGENYGLRFPREFGLLLKQSLYFDRYLRLLAPSLSMQDIDGFQPDVGKTDVRNSRRVLPLGAEVWE